MGSVHGLQIVHGVPIMLHEDDHIGSGKSQTQASNSRGQNEHLHWWVMVELIDDLKSLLGIEGAKKLFILNAKASKDLTADQLQTRAHLAKDQCPMRCFGSISLRYTAICVCHCCVVSERSLLLWRCSGGFCLFCRIPEGIRRDYFCLLKDLDKTKKFTRCRVVSHSLNRICRLFCLTSLFLWFFLREKIWHRLLYESWVIANFSVQN